MYVGLGLTLLALVVPYVDRTGAEVLADHYREGYPGYSEAEIDTAVTTWLVVLTVLGVLGVAGWLWAIQAVEKGRPWARWGVTALFAAAVPVLLAAALIEDTSGDTGLPSRLGVVVAAPGVAGLVAVIQLWRRGSAGPATPW